MSCKSQSSNGVKLMKCDSTALLESNVKLAGEEAKDRLYEPKHKKKLVRVLTVVAYIFFVSLAAIMLSLYYAFLWDGDQKLARMKNYQPTNCIPESIAAWKIDPTDKEMQDTPTATLPLKNSEIDDLIMKKFDKILHSLNSVPLSTKTLTTEAIPTTPSESNYNNDYDLNYENLDQNGVFMKKLLNKFTSYEDDVED